MSISRTQDMSMAHRCLQKAFIKSDLNKIKDHFNNNMFNVSRFMFPPGWTALMLAINVKCCNEVIFYLIDIKSDVNAECVDGKTPLDYALMKNCDKAVISKLIDNGANVNHCAFDRTPLFYAVMHSNDPEVISLLISAGADVNACSVFGRNVLRAISCYSCTKDYCTNSQIIDVLVKNSINLKSVDIDGNTIVHWSDCSYLISLAIENGISVNEKNNQKLTPLMCAVFSFNVDKVKTLLFFNANPNSVGPDSHNPLHLINLPGSNQIFNLLIYHGADLFARNSLNQTPLDVLLSKQTPKDYELQFKIWPFIKHFVLFYDEGVLNDSFRQISDSDKKLSNFNFFVDECKSQLMKMQNTYIKDGLTFYEFCLKTKLKKNKFVKISFDQYKYDFVEIKELFPYYRDIIIMRIKDNYIENCRMVLLKSLEKIDFRPLPVNGICCNENLGYDCLYYICRYLNRKQLFTLFLASTEC